MKNGKITATPGAGKFIKRARFTTQAGLVR
jgi:hypothetical protein